MGEQLVFGEYKSPWWQKGPSVVFAARRRIDRAFRVEQPPGCPLTLTIVKRYWRVRWAGLGVGAWPMLEVKLTNRSTQVVHSFNLRFVAGAGGHPSGSGIQTEHGFLPGTTLSHTNQESRSGDVAACVDFVQFVKGDVWFSGDPESLVTEAGIQNGARAASVYLQSVLARCGAATVMAELARVHAVVRDPKTIMFGPPGSYNGVTHMAVRVKAAFERDGLAGVETVLRSDT